MITTALVTFGKFILSTLLLLAFYSGVLRSKASYTMQRLYLILIPFASIMMSGLTFEVYKPEARIIEMEKPEVMQYYEDHRTTGYAIIADEGGSLESLDVSLVDDLFSAIQNVAEELGIIGLVVCALFAVSAVLLMIAAYYMIKMCILRRRLNAEMTDDGYRLICSGSIKVPFSFADTIFLPADMESGKADYILMHEKAHIAHKHYVDVWIIEFMTRLLWFNPLMWVVRRQLRNVHEYEADRCVVDAGVDMFRYQTILLEEVAEDSMVIANGFYHSFIRSRFIEMKKSAIGCMGIKGKTGTVLWIIALFCAFTFTVGEAETIVRYKDASGRKVEMLTPKSTEADDRVEEETDSMKGSKPIDSVINRNINIRHSDSISIANRKGLIASYRENEMQCFYGNNEPLILFGDRKISRNEYYELAEDTVAFVNFYFSDFVKSYYGPEAGYGLVYVCPRAVKSSIVYDDGLPLPANGRNYVDDFSSLFGNMYDTSVRVRNARYVAQKLREDQELKESGCKARITVSCVVHTDGSIEPKIIEDISNYNDAAIKNMDRIIRIAKEAIATLPNVEPALESLHNKHLNKNVHGTREASLSITTKVE